jgi:cell division protein FtsL
MASFQDKKATLFRLKWVEWIFVNLPFVCYLVLLGVIYISNAHATEKAVRRIESLKQEVKDTKWRAMNLKQEVMHGSIQSQIEKKVEGSGLLPLAEPPFKIVADKNSK